MTHITSIREIGRGLTLTPMPDYDTDEGMPPELPFGWSMLAVVGEVPAGLPIEAIQDDNVGQIVVPSRMIAGRRTFGLRVKGDSMSPEILPGDDVVVCQDREAHNSDLVVARVDGEVTLKRLFLRDDRMILQPVNPAYEPILADPKEVEIVGVVIMVSRRYR